MKGGMIAAGCRRAQPPLADQAAGHVRHAPAAAAMPAPPQVAARIEAAQGEGFLKALKAEWDSHNKSVQVGAGSAAAAWPGRVPAHPPRPGLACA